MKHLFALALCFSMVTFSSSRVNAQNIDNLLGTLGTLGAITMYNTYISIGAIIDGESSGGYDNAYAITLLDEQYGLMDKASEQMIALVDSKEIEDPTDVEYVQGMLEVYQGLREQAGYASLYLSDKSDANADQFNTRRDSNWARISSLLALDEE